MADDVKTEDTAATTKTTVSTGQAMINQITADLEKKDRESAKAKMAKVVGEIREAEKLIRLKTVELQKMQADIEAGIFTS